MLEFCPLCHKNGYKKKIVLKQLNFEEAVWLCESPECPWPFGYQNFTFVSRKVGETWSSNWKTYKLMVPKSSESFSISLNELGLDTPPVTPGSGSEIVQKESISGEGTSSVTSLNLSTNNVIKTKGNFRSGNDNKKLRHPYSEVCGSIDGESTETITSSDGKTSIQNSRSNEQDCGSQEFLSNVNHSLVINEEKSKSDGGFSLSDDVNFKNLDNCLSSSQKYIAACDAAEALTESVFNDRKPLQDSSHSFETTKDLDNLHVIANHKSTVKCKKWLSDNTKNAARRDHCCSLVKTNNIVHTTDNISSRIPPANIPQKDSKKNLNGIKQLPRIKSIEKTNLKVVELITIEDGEKVNSFTENNYTSSITQKKSQSVYSKVIENVHNAVEKNRPNPNAIYHSTLSDKLVPQNRATQEGNSGTCKVENKTVLIDGLPPINLSYEVPRFIEESIVSSNANNKDEDKKEYMKIDLKPQPVVSNSIASINVKVVTPNYQEVKSDPFTTSNKIEAGKQSMKKPLKRKIHKTAKYQGFNFGTLKKKSKGNEKNSEDNIKTNSLNEPSPDNVSTCSDLTNISETSCATTTTIDSKSESIGSSIDSNLKSVSGIENFSPTTSGLEITNQFNPENNDMLHSNLNLDLVLDELLLNKNENLPQTFEDDWLTSLLD